MARFSYASANSNEMTEWKLLNVLFSVLCHVYVLHINFMDSLQMETTLEFVPEVLIASLSTMHII